MLNIAVLVSGGGTNLQALIDAEKAGKIENGKISVVVASKPGVYALERAKNAGIEGIVLARSDYENVDVYSEALENLLKEKVAKGYIRNNGNPLVLQRLLNHSTLQMTNKYVKLYGEDLKEGYDLINPLDSLVRKKKIEKEETRKRKEKK